MSARGVIAGATAVAVAVIVGVGTPDLPRDVERRLGEDERFLPRRDDCQEHLDYHVYVFQPRRLHRPGDE
jgi:hypothetical protein